MHNLIHVLIVEDSLIAQKVIKIQMTKQGCEVDLADDGVSALKKAIKTHYDLILMDIGLGDGPDGFEVTLQIKKQSDLNKNTPIMAVTAHNEPNYREKAIEYGMAGYFNKPFTIKEAEILINRLKEIPV